MSNNTTFEQSTPSNPHKLPSLEIPTLTRRSANPTTYSPTKSPTSLTTGGQPPARQFSLFPRLPAELRLRIWTHALPGPRVVEIKAPGPISMAYGSTFSPTCLDFTSACALPTLLHVNSEARAVALRRYELAFANATYPARIYFDFERDTLYFPEYSFDNGSVADVRPFQDAISAAERARVRRVAIDVDRWFAGRDLMEKEDHPALATVNGQITVASWPGLRELCWVLLEPLPDGRCTSCDDKVRPARLGVVGLEERVEDRSLKFREILTRDTDTYFEELESMIEKMWGGAGNGQGGKRLWKPPRLRIMALTRDGVRVAPTMSEIGTFE